MTNISNKINIGPATAIFTIALLIFLTPAKAHFVFDFMSTGSDGSTAIGFVEFDDTIAPDAKEFENPVGTTGITDFHWKITGGINDGIEVKLADLTDTAWNAISDNLASDFNFDATTATHEFEGFNPFSTFDLNNGVTYTHTLQATVVPIPAAIVMFVPALVGLFGFSTCRNKNKLSALANQAHTNATIV